MRSTHLRALVLLSLLTVSDARAEDLVAIVDLKFLEETDLTAAVICFEEDQCDVWATHYLWEARVRKIISGTEPDRRFLVLFGVHALKQQDFSNVLATMKKLEPGAYANARYQIQDWGEPRELVCFDSAAAPNAPLELKEGGAESQRCFDVAEEKE
jgi:hypothetical protein